MPSNCDVKSYSFNGGDDDAKFKPSQQQRKPQNVSLMSKVTSPVDLGLDVHLISCATCLRVRRIRIRVHISDDNDAK